MMNRKLRSQHPIEPVFCAKAQIGGKTLHFGRGQYSGDWYVEALTSLDPKMFAAINEDATHEGEFGVLHPCGLMLYRLAWLAELCPPAQEQAHRLGGLLERIWKQFPPPSPN
jgi:hypothetical protein